MKNGKKLQIILPVLLTVMILLTGCLSNPYKSGVKALEEKDYKEAAAQFQEAVEKNENKADSYRGLGIALWETEDYKGAKNAFENAIKEGTEKTGTIYNFLGCCELQAGDAGKAVSCFETGLEDKNNSSELIRELRFNQIAAYEKSGDIETAKSLLEDYTADYPDDEAAAKEADFLKTR